MTALARLRDLNGRFSAVVENWTPQTGGTPTGRFQVIFLCPVCRTHEVNVYVGPSAGDAPRTWAASPYPPDGEGWLDRLTVTPSIDNTHNSYRDKPCGFHGHITNGEVTE